MVGGYLPNSKPSAAEMKQSWAMAAKAMKFHCEHLDTLPNADLFDTKRHSDVMGAYTYLDFIILPRYLFGPLSAVEAKWLEPGRVRAEIASYSFDAMQ